IPNGTTSVMYANTIGGNWSYGDINNNTPKATNNISNQTPGESNVYVYAGGGIIIQKESDKEVYQYGDIIDYRITVYSNGIPTTNLTVTDVIPKGLRLTKCPGTDDDLIVAGEYVHICQFNYSQGPNNQSVFHIKAKVTEDISDQQIT
ncbi:MAG: DUF11 domain-containing protein, partial [Candidatus Altiarchaeum hamiconexum]|nr:DUF11 domain-containing protein [Candidatus Altarchaeum hamiconexum]